ncbi:MAG: BACON domain-containing protein [Candidatus Latescibacterota bacterium]|nr:MAG: BACON domain-containing protein [Candidatus Latescibacterota bacterium]
MYRTLLIAVAILLAATMVFAQNGAICLFADPGGTDCNLTDDSPGLLEIYVVHMLSAGAMASQFWAPQPSCMVGATYVGDYSPFSVVIGNSQEGMAIGYGSCFASPIYLAKISYQTSGSTEDDCAYRVMPDPGLSSIEVVDCNSNLSFAGGGKIYLNSTLGCVCEEITPPDLVVSPSSLHFGMSWNLLTFDIMNAGEEVLNWTVADDQAWMTATPHMGTNDATIVVEINRDGLPPADYSGTVSVLSNGGDENVFVTMQVRSNLSVHPTTLDFGSHAVQHAFTIENTGSGVMTWSTHTPDSWISMNPMSGTNDAIVYVTVDRTGLNAGAYTGHVYVNSDGGNATVTVLMNVGPVLSVTPTFLDFGYYGVQEFFEIENDGNGTLSWSVTPNESWILANPLSGENDAAVYVTVNRDGLPNGHHEGTIDVASNGGSDVVTVAVDVGPNLVVTPTSLLFSGTTTEQTFLIRNTGAGTLDWTVSPDSSWMTAHPSSGSDDALITVTAYRCGFEPGAIRNGSIAVTSNGGDENVSVTAHWMQRVAAVPDYLEFEREGTKTRSFDVQTPCAVAEPEHWTVTADSAWISVAPPVGSGEQPVNVTVSWPSWLGDGQETFGKVYVTTEDGLDTAEVTIRVYDFIQVPTEKETWGSVKSKFKK